MGEFEKKKIFESGVSRLPSAPLLPIYQLHAPFIRIFAVGCIIYKFINSYYLGAALNLYLFFLVAISKRASASDRVYKVITFFIMSIISNFSDCNFRIFSSRFHAVRSYSSYELCEYFP